MDTIEHLIKNVSEILKIPEEQCLELIRDAFITEDPFRYLSDLLGLANIELIFEIYKNKENFGKKEYKNVEGLFIEHVIPEAPPLTKKGDLVPVSILKENSMYFSYDHFNPVQSVVFSDVYNSDGNVLISAPTGAGKTDIALLAIIKALKYTSSQIIYIVPMKALATEIYRKYSKLFSKQYSVIEYTGDTEIDRKTAEKARIVICTPEKFDSATRKLSCIFQSIKLVIIDEIHLLEDDRGAVLESIVARMFRITEIKQTSIRIIGLSATLPNYKDVASFIRAEHIHYFDARYRPVPLKMTITGFTKTTKYRDEMNYLLEKVQIFINNEKQVLIFVLSRSKTVKIASFLTQNLGGLKKIKITNNTISKDLYSLASNSIGVHHAGLSRNDRSQMETMFSKGLIKVLVSTSTLAWGINLPAYAVILHGSSFYDQSIGKFADISMLDVLQIFGRAGRPQFDSMGEAMFLISSSKIDHYIKLLKRNKDIESKLLFHVPECLNAEIYLNNTYSIATALFWIKNTFLYIRMMKNPSNYGILDEDLGLEEQALSEYIYLTLLRLEDCKLIEVAKKDKNYLTWTFKSTVYGQLVSLYYLKHLTMYTWLKSLNEIVDEQSLINVLICSEEFKQVSVRHDETSYLNALHNELLMDSIIKFEFDETAESKLNLILIAFLHFKKLPTFSLACDSDFLVENMKRLLAAMKEVLQYLKRYNAFKIAFCLEKKLYRYKKVENKAITITGIKITDDFAELDIKNVSEPSTVFVFDKEKLFYTFLLDSSSTHIFRCNINIITVEVESHTEWRVSKTLVVLKPEFGLLALYRYGIHSCDSVFKLAGPKPSCIHIQEVKGSLEAGLSSLSLSSKTETFNNMIQTNFDLDVELVEVQYSHYKEVLHAMTIMIHRMDFKELLVVCPSAIDSIETCACLNTKAALEGKQSGPKFESGLKAMRKSKFLICTFKEALQVKGFKTVIFKGIYNNTGMYPIYEVFKVANKRKAIIYELKERIEYLKIAIDNKKS
ncbi:hypothetical protein GINT2_001535 [Glugoides intestinalis]